MRQSRLSSCTRASVTRYEESRLRVVAQSTKDDLLHAYPRLTAEDIHAAIGYAADTVAHEETIIVKRRAKRGTARPRAPED